MLLEKLVALSLSTLCLAGMMQLLYSVKTQREFVSQKTNHNTAHMKIRSILVEATRELDEHRLPLLPRTHSIGSLTFTDGVPASINPKIGPSTKSEAFSAVRIAIDKSVSFKSHNDLCLSQERLHALSFSGEEFFEVILRSHQDVTSSACIPATIQIPRRSILFYQPEEIELTFPLFLIPIDSLFSIYLSKEDTLRFIQHRGEEIIENQPVRSDAPIMTFKSSSLEGVYSLELTTRSQISDREITEKLHTVLSRLAPEISFFQLRGTVR